MSGQGIRYAVVPDPWVQENDRVMVVLDTGSFVVSMNRVIAAADQLIGALRDEAGAMVRLAGQVTAMEPENPRGF